MKTNRKKLRKSSIVFLTAVALMLGTFTTSLAASNFTFTINRGMTAKSSVAKKTKKSHYGTVTITSSTANAYQTDFVFIDSSNAKLTLTKTVKNSKRSVTNIPYLTDEISRVINSVRLRGIDSRMTAPNGTIVKGKWSTTSN